VGLLRENGREAWVCEARRGSGLHDSDLHGMGWPTAKHRVSAGWCG